VQGVTADPAGPKYPALAIHCVLAEDPTGLFVFDGQNVWFFEPCGQYVLEAQTAQASLPL